MCSEKNIETENKILKNNICLDSSVLRKCYVLCLSQWYEICC